ncbi:MAG TPA: hypothetical protein VFA28_19760 [Bryobacteraceae bacterium]|nr:hypothetical protein [Bryobacteraceae bacterium]
MKKWILLVALTAAVGARAQERDFLTADEADQIREAQDPNLRLQLYVKFARERLELVKQLLSQEKPGRSALIHDTLEDYAHIIEAIDTVADDALKRKIAITEGMKVVAEAEKKMLAELKALNEKRAADYPRYEFVFSQAIETTQDSADLSAEDLTTRSAEVEAREKKEKADLESMMSAKDAAERKAEQKKEQEKKRKAPTLRRKGEAAPERR